MDRIPDHVRSVDITSIQFSIPTDFILLIVVSDDHTYDGMIISMNSADFDGLQV